MGRSEGVNGVAFLPDLAEYAVTKCVLVIRRETGSLFSYYTWIGEPFTLWNEIVTTVEKPITHAQSLLVKKCWMGGRPCWIFSSRLRVHLSVFSFASYSSFWSSNDLHLMGHIILLRSRLQLWTHLLPCWNAIWWKLRIYIKSVSARIAELFARPGSW